MLPPHFNTFWTGITKPYYNVDVWVRNATQNTWYDNILNLITVVIGELPAFIVLLPDSASAKNISAILNFIKNVVSFEEFPSAKFQRLDTCLLVKWA